MNIRLHHAVRDITGVTGMKILAAIVAGERDPHVLAAMRDRLCKKSEEEYRKRRRERMLKSMRRSISKLAISAEELGFCQVVG